MRPSRGVVGRWYGRFALAGVSVLGLAVLSLPLWVAAGREAWRGLGLGSGSSSGLGPDPVAAGMAIPLPPLGLLLLVAGLGLCLLALTVEAAAGLGARGVALIAVLAAMNSVLRVAENVVPGPGGFSPVFVLIILAGYVHGARFGFLVGVFSMVISALATGFVDPWLPAQAIVAGWVGATAGFLPTPSAREGLDSPFAARAEIVGLAAFGAGWGFLYGALLTLPFWTVLEAGRPASAADGLASGVLRFAAYYGVSSLAWDAFRAAGNAALLIAVGRPTIVALRRVGAWFAADLANGATAETAGVASTVAIAPTAGVASAAGVASTTEIAPTAEIAPPADPLDPRAWALWLAAAVGLAVLVTNPLALAGGVLAIELVRSAGRRSAGGRDGAGASADLPVGRIIVFIVLVAAAYNLLFAHVGGTELARLPAAWPLIGGPLTAESLVYGGLNGLRLALLILAFHAFQTALPARRMMRLIPRGFGTLALLAGVALTWVPATRARAAEVREAARVRGLVGPGPRGWVSLAMPMLVGGLERAMGLAEAMTARGITVDRPPAAARIGLPAGAALLVVAGVAWQVGGADIRWVVGGALAGLVSVGAAMGALARNAPRTSYRPARWRTADTIVVLAAGLPLMAMPMHEVWTALRFSPYPRLALPSTGWPLVLPIVGLAVPALFAGRRTRDRPVGRDLPADRAGAGGVGTSIESPAPGRSSGRAAPLADAGASAPARGPAIRFRRFGAAYPVLGGRARGGSPRPVRPALRDIDATLPGGALTLVVGPSGSGKSTLLRSISGLVPHFSGGSVSGSVRIGGEEEHGWDPVALGPEAMSGRVGFVGGDPARGFVVDRVADEVAFALEQRAVPAVEIRRRVWAALEAVGIAHLAERRIATLSGGERQRVAIAAAVALAPPVLVLDEPTSQLDDESAAHVLEALERIRDGGRRTIVISEHRIERVAAHADHCVWLPAACEPAIEGAPSDLLCRIPRVPIAPPPTPQPQPPPSPPPSPQRSPFGAPVLEMIDVRFAYPADDPEREREERSAPIVDGFGLEVRGGEIVVLTGPSGSGKTTILRLAVGLLAPDAGDIRIEGRDAAALPDAERFARIGYVPQDPDALLSAETVRAEVELGRRAGGGTVAGADAVDTLLGRLGIAELAGRYPGDLSAGQRLRVALAAVFVDEPALLILDEPTRGLDDRALADLVGALYALAAQGCAVLIATHDRRLSAAAHREIHFA